MRNIVLFDIDDYRQSLLPLSFTRPTALLRCGILTVAEKWQLRLDGNTSFLTTDLLSVKFPMEGAEDSDTLFIAGNMLPSPEVVDAVENLATGDSLSLADGTIVAHRGNMQSFREAKAGKTIEPLMLRAPQDIFHSNGDQIRDDFDLITAGRKSAPLPANCTLIGEPSMLFIEEGAKCLCATFNVTSGPIYIGRDAEVMEGCCLRGPVALCEHSTFKMGAKIYEDTTIGPHCKVGGEISNAIFFGYANKAHDGYLGNAVIGHWCNLGAGCVSSNLKNDYSKIRLWNYATQSFTRTDMQFCGLIMGDHSKAGIQTMFNTATVVGVGCNIHGAGFPRTFIPSFSFGGAAGFERVRFNKFIETARTVMARRHIELTEADLEILTGLYALDDYGNPQKEEAQ